MRCISVNKIEITVLSARVLDALSGRGLKAKTVHEFERYGTRRIVKHCLGKGQILYSKETVQNFVWNERAKQESGTLPHYQWGITRRAAVYLDQMAEYGKIQDEPIRPWEAEHNPLFQAISCNPSNSMKVIDIICRTRDAVMQLELSDKTKTNYIYCGFGAILNFFISRGEESYSPETLALFEKTVQENFVNGAMQKASFQTMRKAAHWIEEYLSTGQVSQQKLRKYNFACAPPEFENLLSQYQLYIAIIGNQPGLAIIVLGRQAQCHAIGHSDIGAVQHDVVCLVGIQITIELNGSAAVIGVSEVIAAIKLRAVRIDDPGPGGHNVLHGLVTPLVVTGEFTIHIITNTVAGIKTGYERCAEDRRLVGEESGHTQPSA